MVDEGGREFFLLGVCGRVGQVGQAYVAARSLPLGLFEKTRGQWQQGVYVDVGPSNFQKLNNFKKNESGQESAQ